MQDDGAHSAIKVANDQSYGLLGQTYEALWRQYRIRHEEYYQMRFSRHSSGAWHSTPSLWQEIVCAPSALREYSHNCCPPKRTCIRVAVLQVTMAWIAAEQSARARTLNERSRVPSYDDRSARNRDRGLLGSTLSCTKRMEPCVIIEVEMPKEYVACAMTRDSNSTRIDTGTVAMDINL